MAKITFAICIGCLLFGMKNTINISFMGHESEHYDLIAGVGLGSAFISIFGELIVSGISSALNTLVS